jgi:CHAT domain-containing protein
MADQANGNFFGALAFAPGAANEPADDGYLTLAEVYDLDLRHCELAMLSACQTNYGPEQKGEGVWGLSRGFLVAGSRRVLASNWLVDDAAAASLVAVFSRGAAGDPRVSKNGDFAQSLQVAKRFIRQKDKWSSPYFWGGFVLVGPN